MKDCKIFFPVSITSLFHTYPPIDQAPHQVPVVHWARGKTIYPSQMRLQVRQQYFD